MNFRVPPDHGRGIFASVIGKARLPSFDDAAWRDSRFNGFYEPLLSLAEAERDEPLPALTDELYADFHRKGKRLPFEKVYFERRRRLARAAIAVLRSRQEDSEFKSMRESLIAKWQDVSREPSWALPAHVEDKSGKDPLQIDLFAAETANLMAELLDVFGILAPIEFHAEVKDALETRIFNNYLQRHDEFWWTRTTNNWNAVCHQGVVGAALSQETDPDRLAEIVGIMYRHLSTFLEGFAADGGCSEGPAYWEYGFGRFSELNAQLECRSGGALSLFQHDHCIRSIARYGPRMVFPGERLVNFADCRSNRRLLRPALLCYLGKRLNEPICAGLGRWNYTKLLKNGADFHEQRADFFFLSRQILDIPPAWNPEEESLPLEDGFWPDLSVVVAHGGKGGRWHFAAKAGHNDEHHNHNDCGSYILNIGEAPMIVEIGSPEYVRDFFIPERRYEFLAARTLGHSLPVINGFEQAAGKKFAAKILSCHQDMAKVEFVVDLTQCYPREADCRRAVRSFAFEKIQGSLRVTDNIELNGAGTVETAVITAGTAEIARNVASIEVDGVRLCLSAADANGVWSVEKMAYSDHDGQEAWIYRLALRAAHSSLVALDYVIRADSSG